MNYKNRYGLEAACVLHLEDGRYALIEVELGAGDIDSGAKHLLKSEHLIKEYNKTEVQCLIRMPNLKIVITGTQYGHKRDDGVLAVPIGCSKNDFYPFFADVLKTRHQNRSRCRLNNGPKCC